MDCSKCVHRIVIAGNYHIGCNKPTSNPERVTWKGCGLYPINFDPNTIKTCEGFSEDENDKLPNTDTPMMGLARILMG